VAGEANFVYPSFTKHICGRKADRFPPKLSMEGIISLSVFFSQLIFFEFKYKPKRSKTNHKQPKTTTIFVCDPLFPRPPPSQGIATRTFAPACGYPRLLFIGNARL
jgi:hypothetical protein